ncbi:MAG TPA: hypothetical protein VJ464_01815 [Blastocatellia bacterium]|nr:hypothetical protein [Blastocatellia bacterium]
MSIDMASLRTSSQRDKFWSIQYPSRALTKTDGRYDMTKMSEAFTIEFEMKSV